MRKRGISGIIVTILLILISLIAVAILWGVIQNLIESSSSKINTLCLTSNLDIDEYALNENNLTLRIKRGAGKGEVIKGRFKFYNSEKSFIIDKDLNIQELERKNILFNSDELGNISDIYKISIAPILSLDGNEKTCSFSDTKKIREGEGSGNEGEDGEGEGGIALTGCSNLDSPGNYVLDTDISISDDCFYIESNDVLIDCQNHILENNGRDTGVTVYSEGEDLSNVTIKNCRFFGWRYGIEAYEGIYDLKIYNNLINNSDYSGLSFYEVGNFQIFNNLILNSGEEGVYFEYTNNGLVYNNLFDNEENIVSYESEILWNTTKTAGSNIIGGNIIGGNYWGDSNGDGVSDRCSDSNNNGICDNPVDIGNSVPGQIEIDYLALAS